MPEPPAIRTPLPDAAHEALRAGLVGALDDLTAEVRRVDSVLLLLLTTADFAQSTLNTAKAAREQIAQQTAVITALAARIEALEQASAPEPAPEPSPELIPEV